MNSIKLVIFALTWAGILYLLNSLIAGQFKKIQIKQAVLYFTTVAMIGVFGEIFLDTVYKFFAGNPLWRYNILPIHHAYTSAYAPIIWGIYGFHLYLLHGTLGSKYSITRTRHLALIFCLEALILEALFTITSRLYLGQYMYYYYPGDLWHVSSLQNIPFYFVCGAIIIKSLRRFKSDPAFFSALCTSLVVVIVFLTS